jgi:AAA domain
MSGFLNTPTGPELRRMPRKPKIWVVQDFLPVGLTLFVAPPKIGKSWWVAQLGLSAASGTEFLGCIPMEQRRVLYISVETPIEDVIDRYSLILGDDEAPLPAKLQTAVHSDVTPGGIRALEADMEDWLEAFQDERPLIILDTLGRIRDWSANKDYLFAARMKAMLDRYPSSSLILVHHPTKSGNKDFVQAGGGGQGLAGGVDTILYMTRDRVDNMEEGKSYPGVMSITSRVAREGRYAILITDGTWRLDGDSLKEAAANASLQDDPKPIREERLGEISLSILEQVNTIGGECTPLQIAEALGLNNNVVGVYMRRLADNHHIKKMNHGVYVAAASVA